MHQAESSLTLFCLWTGLSLPVALHPASRRRSYLPLRTGQCSRPIGTFTLLLVRTLRRTPRPRAALLLLRPLSVGRFASLRFPAKKYGTPYFSARKRTSKYSRSCSQSLAELLRLRKTHPLWFFRAIWPGTPDLACRQRVRCSHLDSPFCFAQAFCSRFLPDTPAIPSAT